MRRTRILATLGPASSEAAVIRALIEAGADAFRLNFSHGSAEAHAEICGVVRAEAKSLGRQVMVLQDLSGPKIRTGPLAAPMTLARGDVLVIEHGENEGGQGRITSSFAPLFESVAPGHQMLLDDGRLSLLVTRVDADRITTTVVEGGVLDSRKGIHVPGGVIQTAALTDKDRRDLKAGVEMGVDAVALSFVQSKDDIAQVRQAAKAIGASDMPIIAKIERPSAVDQIEEIVPISDGVMIARGDLGIELPLETLPAVQRRVMLAARRRGVPVIVATEVLESMRSAARPTRAEVTDAAHAVDEGADAIMLSGETAVGRNPVRVVSTLSAIISATERSSRTPGGSSVGTADVIASRHGLAVCEAAVTMASRSGASAIVAVTKAGMTPRVLAALRPAARIIAATSNERTAARLSLVWGVTTMLTEANALPAVREMLLSRELVPRGETIVFVAMHLKLGQEADNYVVVERM